MYEESNLGCDHNEKGAKAEICSDTPLIPKGVFIPNMAAGRSHVTASSFQFMQVSQVQTKDLE